MEVHLVHLNSKYETIDEGLRDPYGLAVIGVFFDVDEDLEADPLKVPVSSITDSIHVSSIW